MSLTIGIATTGNDGKPIGRVKRTWVENGCVYAAIELFEGDAMTAIIASNSVGIAGYRLADAALDEIATKAVGTPFVDRTR